MKKYNEALMVLSKVDEDFKDTFRILELQGIAYYNLGNKKMTANKIIYAFLVFYLTTGEGNMSKFKGKQRKPFNLVIAISLPLIFITIVAIVYRAFIWQIMIQIYLIYSTAIIIIYWILKSDNRKNIFILLIGSLFLVGSIIYIASRISDLQNSNFTTGIIREIEVHKGAKSKLYVINLSFKDQKNRTINVEDVIDFDSSLGNLTKGDSVKIYYNKDNAESASIYVPEDVWFPVIITSIIGLGWFGTGLIRLINKRNKLSTSNKK